MHDFNRDGKNDFVVGSRKIAPAVVWYRRATSGWDRIVIEPEMLRVEAGGAVADIDGDARRHASLADNPGSHCLGALFVNIGQQDFGAGSRQAPCDGGPDP